MGFEVYNAPDDLTSYRPCLAVHNQSLSSPQARLVASRLTNAVNRFRTVQYHAVINLSTTSPQLYLEISEISPHCPTLPIIYRSDLDVLEAGTSHVFAFTACV